MEARNGDGFLNSVKMLRRREINGYSRPKRCFSTRNSQEIFRNISLQEEHKTQDPSYITVLPLLRWRAEVIDIVSAHGIVFALLQSGVCAAFSRETNQRLCYLNVTSDEVIASLFYYKYNDSVFTLSYFESDSLRSLICRTTRIENIQCGQPDAGSTLFESESLKWPSCLVEFDDVNAKILTFCAQKSVCKVFDLKNYTMLYSISDKDVKGIRISPSAGIILFIYTKVGVRQSVKNSYVPLKILSIEDGSVLKSFNYLLHRKGKVEIIEQCNEKLLVKQKTKKLQILDVRTSDLIEVSETEFIKPSEFFFFPADEQKFFMTFRNQRVDVWNFKGQIVTSFEDHLPWRPRSNTNNIYLTRDQDLIISYCKDGFNHRQRQRCAAGSLIICNMLTGKCIAKINAGNTHMLRECMCSGRRCKCNLSRPIRHTEIRSTVAQALKDVTAILYDEEVNEIYTGNGAGLLHVWSS